MNTNEIIKQVKKLKPKIKDNINIHINEDIFNKITQKETADLSNEIKKIVGTKTKVNINSMITRPEDKLKLAKLAIAQKEIAEKNKYIKN
jgi:predicted Mrr-cat superfamily restriction endonuclease